MAVVGYVRVSTQKQDTDNQRGEIERWGEYHRTQIDYYVSETISSRKNDREIFALAETLREGDTLIVTELSRIARSLSEIIKVIAVLTEKKIRVVILKENIDLRDDNPMGMFAIHIIGAFAELERGMISKRTKASIESKRAAGVSVGRPRGAKNKTTKLTGKEKKIQEYLSKGMKKTEIAKILGVHRDTLYDFMDENGIVTV